MEARKHQFLIISIVLLCIGFLQYFRKIAIGFKMNKVQKILYLTTMVTFTVGIMIALYFSNFESLLSFCLGLTVCICSEHIAKMFLVIGDKFNLIVINIVKTWIGVDLSEELKDKDSSDKESTDSKSE